MTGSCVTSPASQHFKTFFVEKQNLISTLLLLGTLDSQLSLNQACNGKNFIIKDKTGTLRYTFIKYNLTVL